MCLSSGEFQTCEEPPEQDPAISSAEEELDADIEAMLERYTPAQMREMRQTMEGVKSKRRLQQLDSVTKNLPVIPTAWCYTSASWEEIVDLTMRDIQWQEPIDSSAVGLLQGIAKTYVHGWQFTLHKEIRDGSPEMIHAIRMMASEIKYDWVRESVIRRCRLLNGRSRPS